MESKEKGRKQKAEGRHLWNSCGSEAGKSERKQTEKPSRRTEEGRHERSGPRETGKTEEAKAKDGHWRSR